MAPKRPGVKGPSCYPPWIPTRPGSTVGPAASWSWGAPPGDGRVESGRGDRLLPTGSPAVLETRRAERQISPTDISQFVRLDQCERYLRLRLRERAEGRAFLRDYGVAPQSIPPLLTRSGSAFEGTVERAVAQPYPTKRFTPEERQTARRDDDNALVADAARGLRRAASPSCSSRGCRATLTAGASGAMSMSCDWSGTPTADSSRSSPT